ncbi:toMV susceptible protein tm-1(GCR26)-like [Vitis vinifera]|nr:toMV susceptible protein tm-1(GCR26)-like [Vitis vinifera]
MAQRTVLKVDIWCPKCQKKLLQAVSGLEGVNTIDIDATKGLLTVTGEADPYEIIVRARKACKHAEVVTIGPPPGPSKKPEKEKPEQNKPGKEKTEQKKPQKEKPDTKVHSSDNCPMCQRFAVIHLDRWDEPNVICSILGHLYCQAVVLVDFHMASSSQKSLLEVQVTVVDVSTHQNEIDSVGDFIFVPRKDILSCYFGSMEQTPGPLPEDRGKAVGIMSKALEHYLKKAQEDHVLAGAIGIGGSGGTSIISSAFKSVPIGMPKIIVSTVASGQTEPYVGTSDLILFPSVVDVCGINNVSRVVLSNAGAAFAGMVIGRLQASRDSLSSNEKFTVGVTMFGVTTPCVNAVKERLVKEGYETLVFHATGTGGRAMEDLVRGGFIQGVLDITTTSSN